MQSRPSLTLRKPSSAPSPEAIAAFVESGNDESEREKSSGNTGSTPVGARELPGPAQGAERSSLTAPAPTLRAVPATSATDSIKIATPSFRRASRAVVERRTRPARRRTTIYFDVDVATELAAVLTARDQELSDVVNDVVREWLAKARAR